MNTLIIYVVQSALFLSLFYGLYLLLLRHEAFFRFNRSVLLVIMAASMILPTVRIPVAEPALIQAPMMQLHKIFMPEEPLQTIVPSEIARLEMQTITTSEIPTTAIPEILAIATQRLTTVNIISMAYFAGFFVSLIFALVSMFSVARIIATARPVMFGQRRIMVSPRNISSFTFAGWIVISEMDYERFASEIVTHETIHLRSGHFGDLCLVNALAVIQWFNPLVWLLRRELKALHEYEADRQTLTQGINATRYKLLLIEKTVGASRYSVANGFAQKKIKNRIDMMNKKNRNLRARWRVLLLIPPAALMTFACARPRPEINPANEQISTVIGNKILHVEMSSRRTVLRGATWEDVEELLNSVRATAENIKQQAQQTTVEGDISNKEDARVVRDIAVSTPNVYVAGYVSVGIGELELRQVVSPFTGLDTTLMLHSEHKQYAVLWKNGVVQQLSDGTKNESAHSVFVSGNDVYVAGSEQVSNNTYFGKIWLNGIVQTTLTESSQWYTRFSILVNDDNVYLTGKDVRSAKIWKNGGSTGSTTNNALNVFVSGDKVYHAGTEENEAKLWKDGVEQKLALEGIVGTILNSEAFSVFVE